jgi:uncharacterized protein YbjT (DUF2867 family)
MKVAVAGGTGRVGRHAVDALTERGHEAVVMSRATGVDVITGEGLADALAGVEVIVDATTGPSPEQQAATDFFVTAARNLQEFGARAGVRRIVVVSIIGTHHFTSGYGVAKMAHEEATLEGPVPARILRAAQFHELVEQLTDWGRRGDVTVVQSMRTQVVSSRSVGEALAELAVDPDDTLLPTLEIAGPREERLVEMARLLAARRGDTVPIVEEMDPDDPDHQLYVSGALLPGPYARLAGPTYEEWLEATYPAAVH